MRMFEIETRNGVYKLKEPTGPLALRLATGLMKRQPILNPEEIAELMDENLSDEEFAKKFYEEFCSWPKERQERYLESYTSILEFLGKDILPRILIDGPFPYEEIPMEDMMQLCLELHARFSRMETFRMGTNR